MASVIKIIWQIWRYVDILITAKGSLYDIKPDMILASWRVVEAPFSEVYTEPSTPATRHAITQHYFF